MLIFFHQKRRLRLCFLGFKKIGNNLASTEGKKTTDTFYTQFTTAQHKTEIERKKKKKNGTNAGEVKRSDLRHFLEQSRNHGLLRPRRLERDLEENRRRMVRRDRVRDRTDRGDRDVRFVFSFSPIFYRRLSLFPMRCGFGFLSLSRTLFKRTCV